MIKVSEIKTAPPETFATPLQEKVYEALEKCKIPYERVDTDHVVTMEDCEAINDKLQMDIVKTLFLCNRQQTQYYLFITRGDKAFQSKEFSAKLGIARVSFAPVEQFEALLGTKIGAATIFSALVIDQDKVQIVVDEDVAKGEWYGCSDGTTTGYMKVPTRHVLGEFLKYARCKAMILP